MANNDVTIKVTAKDVTAAAWRSVRNGAKAAARGVGRALKGVGRFGKQAAVAIGLVGAAALAASKHLIGFASAAEETETKFAAVFRTTIKTARVISKDLAESFDLAESTAQEMLSSTADLLTGFGFSGEEALKMADKVNRLGIDLASFTNFSKGAAGASQALTKLLLGETEQAKSLGIVVRQGSKEFKDAVAAKQKNLGLTLLQAKAQTALEMAYAQSINAIGDYERTQDGVANKQRATTEAFKEAREELGKAIIEHSSYADMLSFVIDKTRELTESGLIELWAQNVASALQFLTPLANKLGSAFGTIKTGIQKGAAFAGALTAGSSISEAKQIAEGMPAQIEKEKRLRLSAIREERAAKVDIKTIEENALMLVEKKLEAERLISEEQERAAKAEEAAGKKRLADVEKLKTLNEQIANAQQAIRRAEEQDRIKAADGGIEGAQGKIALLARTTDDRRADARAARKLAFDAKKGREAQDKRAASGRRGRPMSKNEKRLAALADQRDQIQRDENQKKVAQANLEQMAKDDRQNAIDQLKELRLIKTDLAKNLQAAGG